MNSETKIPDCERLNALGMDCLEQNAPSPCNPCRVYRDILEENPGASESFIESQLRERYEVAARVRKESEA
jgi:hypothetical protein